MPPDIYEKSKPEFVAPLVLFLASKDCPVSGNIYNVGMGFFNRAAVVTGPGRVLSGDGEFPTVETVQKLWDQASSLEGGKEYPSLTPQVGDVLAAFEKA